MTDRMHSRVTATNSRAKIRFRPPPGCQTAQRFHPSARVQAAPFRHRPETNVNLIFLDRDCLDKDTNSNEAIAVSRITQNDQIGLLEPRVGT